MIPAKIIHSFIQPVTRVFLALKTPPACLKYSLLPAFLLLFQGLLAQKKIQNEVEMPGVEQFLQRNKKQLGKAVALVYRDGKVIYQKSTDDYFNAKSQAQVPAVSKWFTAAVVLTFVDEGKISLDDPVSKYLPVMNKYMKSYVTIRQCLAHATGIESEKGTLAKIFERKKFAGLEQMVNAYAAREISNNAGTEFHYGNIGAAIAGRVVEVVSKKSFDRLAQERLFRPLKMRSSTFTDFSGTSINPASGAQSSAADLANFLGMLLNKGVFEGKQILSEAAVAEMMKAQFADLPVKFTPESMQGVHHGLGVWLLEEDEKGNTIVAGNLGALGTVTYLDNCRKYAAVLFVEKPFTDTRKDLSKQFRRAVEEEMGVCGN